MGLLLATRCSWVGYQILRKKELVEYFSLVYIRGSSVILKKDSEGKEADIFNPSSHMFIL